MACGGSVPCLPYGNYTFTSQADIDNFHLAFPNCTELEGDHVLIIDMIGGDISNLNGLSMLTSIVGDFSITYNSLTSLAGLEGLTSIGGELRIESSSALTNLEGLEGLTSIGNGLRICINDALTSLAGLEGLNTLIGDLNIGYENKWGETYGNPSLTSLMGLEGLTTIRENLNIGIPLWECCGNPALNNLTGLENITFIGNLNIHNNKTLNSLAGIEHLDPDSVGGLAISYNGSLAACNNPFVCNYIKDQSADIHDNAPGCNSVEEVEEACASVGAEESVAGSRQTSVIAYPNPTSGIVNLHWTMDNGQWTILKVYNAQGQQVAIVLDEKLPAGEHTVRWDAGTLPAGIYFYRLAVGGQRSAVNGKIVTY
jgi:hypothetical protein